MTEEIKTGDYVRDVATNITGVVSKITDNYIEFKTTGDGLCRTHKASVVKSTAKNSVSYPVNHSSSSTVTNPYTSTSKSYNGKKLRQLVINDAVKMKGGSGEIGHIVKRKNQNIWIEFGSLDKRVKTTPSEVIYVPPGDGIPHNILVGICWTNNNKRIRRVTTLQNLVIKIRKNKIKDIGALIMHNNRVYPGTLPPTEEDIALFKEIVKKRQESEEIKCT